MKMLKWLWLTMAVLALVACGGSVSTSSDDDGGGTTSSAKTVEVLASSNQVGTGGDELTITVFVKDAGNVSLAAVPVSFTSTSGTLSEVSAETNEAGAATAKLSAGADRSNRDITVSVVSGSASGSVKVAVAGTTLTVSGASTVSLGNSEELTVKATDSKGNVIPNVDISVSSSRGNSLSRSTVTTDGQGNASVQYTATVSGGDSLTFSGVGASTSSTIQVSGEDFAFASPDPSTTIPVGSSQAVTVRYALNGVPQAGKTVTFASTSGTVTPTSATTNAQGEATVTIASNSATRATVQATMTAPAAQATLPVEFIATVPATLVLQVTPTAIGPNPAGSTAQQAQVIATVRDASGNPVKNKTVNFTRESDPSGGNLNQVSAITNSSGQASVQYIAGALSTASNGVELRASVADATTVTNTATLTVNQSALFIALGTGNTISNVDETTYNKVWTVYVTDANGNPVSDVTLTMKVLPNAYDKGGLVYSDDGRWVKAPSVVTCDNEDKNFNGVLDTDADLDLDNVVDANADIDLNENNRLEPGNVIFVTPGTVTTDSGGRATVNLRYAESYAPWVQVRLRAEAVVQGTESSVESLFYVDGLSSDFTNESIPPAGVESPFGENACDTPN